jgi:hypothetical protein
VRAASSLDVASPIGERAIEAELPTDVDGCKLERVNRGPEETLDERLRLLGRVG